MAVFCSQMERAAKFILSLFFNTMSDSPLTHFCSAITRGERTHSWPLYGAITTLSTLSSFISFAFKGSADAI
jgi:hypothetical protein